MIDRILKDELLRLSAAFPVVTVNGPRQSGKTTLCKMAFPEFDYITLEDLSIREFIASNPAEFLKAHSNGLVIDEAQYLPELFSYIQVLVDEKPQRRFILTGSSNFSLLQNISQSLAGRTAILTLLPLSLQEIATAEAYTETDTLLLKGGYPAVWGNGQSPKDVYSNYYSTYVERDLRQLINIKNLTLFQQFTRLSAGRAACEFVASDFSNELGVDIKTIQQWNSILETSYIIFMLPPYFRNVGKRIIKTHKCYFYDTGLLCFLLGIQNEQQLAVHPLRGNIFENMIVADMMKSYFNRGEQPKLFFYRDKSQKEVDVVSETQFDILQIYEIKSSTQFNPSFTKGLDYFKNLYGEKVAGSTVIYDGCQELQSQYDGYVNFRKLKV